MPFIVPKFIQRKPKIVGPFTFEQSIYLGVAAAICIVLYYNAPFYIFLLGLIVFTGGSSFLAFGKVQGIPMPTIIKNFFYFSASSKIYLWKKSDSPPKLIRKKKTEEEEKKEGPVLDVASKSRLKKLSTKIEMGER